MFVRRFELTTEAVESALAVVVALEGIDNVLSGDTVLARRRRPVGGVRADGLERGATEEIFSGQRPYHPASSVKVHTRI